MKTLDELGSNNPTVLIRYLTVLLLLVTKAVVCRSTTTTLEVVEALELHHRVAANTILCVFELALSNR